MADEKKYRTRWDHLNEFQRDGTGNYVYTGKTFVFDGDERSRKRFLTSAGIGGGLLFLFTVFPECLPPVPISRSFITLIPWLGQLISVLTAVWATGRLILQSDEMRAYRLAKTVRVLPARCMTSAVFAFLTLACQTGFGFYLAWSDIGWNTVLRLVTSAGAIAVSLFLFLLHKGSAWREKY